MNKMERSRDKSKRKFNSRMQAKLLLVFCVVALCLFGLIGRLIFIVRVDGAQYAKRVLSRQSYQKDEIPYRRGEILDRTGTVLARSELQYRLIIDPKQILTYEDNIEATIEALHSKLGIEEEVVREVIRDKPNSRYAILLKNITYETMTDFKALMKEEDSKIVSVWFEEEYVRTYPYGTLASDILGFTSNDDQGYWGIEEYYNNELNGVNGREYGYYDSTLNIERTIKKPVNGNSIVSTIDINAQRILQKHIKIFNEEIGSKEIAILAMNPNTGEIIAMASNVEYDLNNPRDLSSMIEENVLATMTEEEKLEQLNLLWRNDIISNGFELGSTFKPVTIAAGLEEAIISHERIYHCDGGEMVNGKYIRCSNKSGHGDLTLTEVLMKSCNDGLMQIVAEEGTDIFLQYQKSFGFGEKTGIDLPGEASGILFPKDKIGPIELATISFGQAFSATMLQMAAAYSSVVNGGYYYKPHIVKEILNEQGAIVNKIEPVITRQTISDDTSVFLQKALYQTVEAGTAKGAKVEGYSIGGKTGTAQKIPYADEKYIVSFIGSIPAVNPELVLYVIVDEPNVDKQADSSIATKFASRIMKELLPALGILPEGDIDYLLEDIATVSGNKPEGESPEGESPEGERPEGDSPEGEREVGESPEGESPEGESPEGDSPGGGSNSETDPQTDPSADGIPGASGNEEEEFNGSAISSEIGSIIDDILDDSLETAD